MGLIDQVEALPGGGLVVDGNQWYLEAKPQIWDAPIALAHCLEVSSWCQSLIRNGISEEPQNLGIYLHSSFMCFGNQGSLHIIVTGTPGIEA